MGKLKKILKLISLAIKDVSVLKTFRTRIAFGKQVDVVVFKNACIKIKKTASVLGNGKLSIGIKWPGFCYTKSVFTLWNNAKLIMDGDFRIHTGCRVIVDEGGELNLGSGYINSNSIISCFDKISIGHNVAISENVTIRDSDSHGLSNSDHATTKPIFIGNNVWICMNSIILKGVSIGDGSVIAAGSLVNKDVPPNTLVGGVPARIIENNIEWNP